MLSKVVKGVMILGGTSLGLARLTGLDFESFPLSGIYPKLRSSYPVVARSLLRSLVYWHLVRTNRQADNFLVLDEGWDTSGEYLEQLYDYGFDMVIAGPSCFDSNQSQMGVRFILLKIKEMKERHPQRQTAISIVPADDVCVYAPYLISVDLCRTIEEVSRVVDFVIINLDDTRIPKEYVTLSNIKELYENIDKKTSGTASSTEVLIRHRGVILNRLVLGTQFGHHLFRDALVLGSKTLSQFETNQNRIRIVGPEQFDSNPGLLNL